MFTNKELEQMRAIAYGGYKTVPTRRVRTNSSGGYKTVGGGIDYGYYGGQGSTGMPGFNMKQDPVSRNFGRIAKELGIKSIDSKNDIAAIYDYLGRNTTKSTKKETKAPESVSAQAGQGNKVTVNNPETVSTPGVEDETYYNKEDSTGTTGFDINNLGRFGGRADRFGMADIIGAYNSGYSFGDINNFISTLSNNPGWRDAAAGGYNSEGPGFKALQDNMQGRITTGYYNPTLTGHGGDHDQYFGHADLMGNRKAGFTDRQIMAFLDANPNKLRGGNVKGAQGGLYETLKAGLPPEPRDPTNLMIGSTGLGNSGTASGVKPKRSKNSQSGRSSYGTSQYNRSNFGTARSPLAIGLNI